MIRIFHRIFWAFSVQFLFIPLALAKQEDAGNLQNMHDIMLADPVPWWPPAPGWYFIALLMLGGLAWGIIAFLRRRAARRYRKVALRELEALRHAANTPEKRTAALRELPVLLKRVALAAWPRNEVASLTGSAWWRFLDENGGGQAGDQVFVTTYGPFLDTLTYGKASADAPPQETLNNLFGTASKWIKKHPLPPVKRS